MEKEKAGTTSDIFSLLGTLILWVYWPSFVAGATPAGTPDAELQLVQTILSLTAATLTTFSLSSSFSTRGACRPPCCRSRASRVSVGRGWQTGVASPLLLPTC